MGEKFEANPLTGTGRMSVPVYASPGRGGFGPELALSYDSGNGNGPFGFGWSLALPAITRKTEQGLPRYADDDDSDVFLLSGAEDLVPLGRRDAQGRWLLGADGRLQPHEDNIGPWCVRRWRPRIEGLFARIERWTRRDDPRDVHWRSISRDNVLTLYGLDAESRVADPADPRRIYSWLICETRDDRGQAMLYRYGSDPLAGDGGVQRYLERIHYGNRRTLLDGAGQRPRFLANRGALLAEAGAGGWMFELVFDWQEEATAGAAAAPRADAFSHFRAGFEVRTERLCHRVRMVHHFPDDPEIGLHCTVRSTDMRYRPGGGDAAVYTALSAVVQTGWQRQGAGWLRSSLPALEFEYTAPVLPDAVDPALAATPQAVKQGDPGAPQAWPLPLPIDGQRARLVDLHGEGASGLLSEQPGGSWLYRRNWSALGSRDSTGRAEPRFGPPERVATLPNTSLAAGAEFRDLAGDGQPDLVLLQGPTPGLWEHDGGEGWQPWRAFTSLPVRDLRDPRVRFIDLDGDGHADLLLSEDEAEVWHASLAEAGFGPAQRVLRMLDDAQAPRLALADRREAVMLADISGDGLADIVRVRNGEVCWWPNLGYGRFGAKRVMANSPWFDHPDQFDPQRLRLLDADGSGTTDVLYLHPQGVRLYLNRSGNGFAPERVVATLPRVDALAHIQVADLLGDGTACLVWWAPGAVDAPLALHALPLMSQGKPHLLAVVRNNLGAETRVEYAPSTHFSQHDRLAGRPWATRLPFPVQLVHRVWSIDAVSRSRFCTRYAYHDGFFDGEEREFRGFGMVEQWDSEEHAVLAQSEALTDAPLAGPLAGRFAENIDPASHVPPVHSKTWFHTGAPPGPASSVEPWHEPGQDPATARARSLEDPAMPEVADAATWREAWRALKGQMLRQEVYADDGSALAGVPYTVTEQRHAVRLLQPREAGRHAVFMSHCLETLHRHYERHAADPRVQHELTLDVDDWGHVLAEARIGYGRRAQLRESDGQGGWRMVANTALAALQPEDAARQTTPLLAFTQQTMTADAGFVGAAATLDYHRAPLPCESRSWELSGYPATGRDGRWRAEDLMEVDPARSGRMRLKSGSEVPFEGVVAGPTGRRPIEWRFTLYRRDDLSGALPFGQLEGLALPFESYQLALSSGLIAQTYRRQLAGAAAATELLNNPSTVLEAAGYVASGSIAARADLPAGHWWLPSGRSFFSEVAGHTAAQEVAQAQRDFFVTRRWRDPFGAESTVALDADQLLLREHVDALDNRTRVVRNDYRVLQPRRVADPNGNHSEVRFDVLGLVVGTASLGKADAQQPEGGSFDNFEVEPDPNDITALFDSADPMAAAITLVAAADTRLVYDLHRFERTRAAAPNDPSSWLPSAAALLTRETHHHAELPPQGLRVQVGFTYSDGFGREVQKKRQAEPGPLLPGGPHLARRWVASGWTVFDNKGRPVRQYEPFFCATQGFEFGVRVGISPVQFYDPVGRAVATLHPNHAWEKVVFDAWQQVQHDVNDTVLDAAGVDGDPARDPNIGPLVRAHLQAHAASGQPWLSWYAQRRDGSRGADEQRAAEQAAAHAGTPTTTHLDVLGRPFLREALNRVICPGHDRHNQQSTVASRTLLDIEGLVRTVRDAVVQGGDAQGRIVMRAEYDLLGRRIAQHSLDAGSHWTLFDAAGQPCRHWDSRGHDERTDYDALRRPLARRVRGQGAEADPRTLGAERVVERVEYGEAVPDAQRLNLRTRVWRHFDGAGLVVHGKLDSATDAPLAAYDFQGNLLHATRQLARDHRALADWTGAVALDEERFESSTRYDALGRPQQLLVPHSNLAAAERHVLQPRYNEAGLLDGMDLWLRHAAAAPGLLDAAQTAPEADVGVADIGYDAKGQRQRITYKNGARTEYRYDPETFRLRQLYTRRGVGFTADCDNPQPPPATIAAPEMPLEGVACGLQNLHYHFDPAGNLLRQRDGAQQRLHFDGALVEAGNDYVYDALYQLVQASGREHLGQGAAPPHTHDDAGRIGLAHPADGAAMGTYVERYVYDAVGNIEQMQHRRGNPALPGWTRAYRYAEPSMIERGPGVVAKTGNRLSATTLNPDGAAPINEPYRHDGHGNLVRMPHLGGSEPASNLHWDANNRLARADLGGGGTAYYVYDAAGQRVRKVWEKSAGLVEERIYLGGFEIFRRHEGNLGAQPRLSRTSAKLERETLHVMDDQRRIALVELRTRDTAGSDPSPERQVRYQLADHVGSATLELDGAAKIVSFEEYAPFGSTTLQALRSTSEVAKRYRFTGKERDEGTGLYAFGARHYAAWLGRWTACDPGGLADGNILYAYARNQPIDLNDPSGGNAAAVAEWGRTVAAGGGATALGLLMDDVTVIGAVDDVIIPFALAAAAVGLVAWGGGSLIDSFGRRDVPLLPPVTLPPPTVRPKPETKPAPGPRPDVKPDPKPDVKPVPKPEAKPAPKPDTKPRPTTPKPPAKPKPKLKPEPHAKPDPKVGPKLGPDIVPPLPDEKGSIKGRIYVTYTATHPETGLVYSGRTDMPADLSKPLYPQALAALAMRYLNVDSDDQLDPEGWGPAVPDTYDVGLAHDRSKRYSDRAYHQMRGREQQLMDYYGGAWSDTGQPPRTGNEVRGVAKDNPHGPGFHAAASARWGELHPYTGH